MSQSHLTGALDPGELNANNPYIDSWGVLHVSQHRQVLYTLSSDNAFSADYPTWRMHHPDFAAAWAADGERHRKLRELVVPPLSIAAITALPELIRSTAQQRLDALVTEDTTGHIELMEWARDVASHVICQYVGIEEGMEPFFRRWVDEVVAAPSPEEYPRHEEMVSYFTALLKERKTHPLRQPRVLDDLIAKQSAGYMVEGASLSDWDLLASIWSLLVSGTETIATTIGTSVLALVEFGWQALREDRTLLVEAIPELYRLSTSFPVGWRTTRHDLRLGGLEIAAGTAVAAHISAANRDPAVFPEPHQFRPERRNQKRHLAFGRGEHACPALHLASLELRIALEALLDRFPTLQGSDRQQPVIYRRGGLVHSLSQAHFHYQSE